MVRNGGVLTSEMFERTWQLADTKLLAEDPIGTVWYLHVQPPLYNLGVGVLLRWSPFPVIGTLYVLYMAMLLLTGLVLWDLLVRWEVHPLVAGAVGALVVSEPDLLRTAVWNSYEIPVALMLTMALWFLQRFVQVRAGRWLVATSAALTAASLTRSVVHPVFVVAVVVLAGWWGSASRRALLAAGAVPLVLVGGWMAHNAVLFDTFTTSSWSGFNLQRGVTAPMERGDVETAVADGTVTSNALVQPWQGLDAYRPPAPCTPDHRHRSLSEENQSDTGSTNLDNACFLPLYSEAESNALALVKAYPGRYLRTRAQVLPTSFGVARVGLPEDLPLFVEDVRPDRTWMDTFADFWQLPTSESVDMRGWNLPLVGADRLPYDFSWTLAALTAFLLGRAVLAVARLARAAVKGRRSSTGSDHDALHADEADPDGTDALLTDQGRVDGGDEILWMVAGALVGLVVVGGSMVEFGENGRFRAIVDPLIVGLPIGALARGVSARFTAHR
ncbi:MAG: hypothetical protein KDB02_02530 [Acidimicrobiales bacterium]|nr:hypothetical protein [Acidimicrobiales bacterium]